jgi:hypothetical protein
MDMREIFSGSQDYRKLLQSNLRFLIERQGLKFSRGLQCISSKQLYRVAKGDADITVGKLGDIANEIEVDIREFFTEAQ